MHMKIHKLELHARAYNKPIETVKSHAAIITSRSLGCVSGVCMCKRWGRGEHGVGRQLRSYNVDMHAAFVKMAVQI